MLVYRSAFRPAGPKPQLSRRQLVLEESLASVKHRKPKPVSLPVVRGLDQAVRGGES